MTHVWADSSADYSTDFGSGANDWTENIGIWAVEDGEYSQSSTSYYNANSVLTGKTYTDCVIEVDMKLMQSDGSWGGINFRKTNADDGNATGYLLVSNVGGDLILLKDGGTYLGYASTGISFYNTFVHIKIVTRGSSIKVYVNKETTPRIDVVDTSYQCGYVSLNTCFTHVHFDNVSISESPGYFSDFSNGASDWTKNIGIWAVEDGEYSQSSTSFYNANSVLTGRTFSDCTIEADMKLMQSDGSWGGINFRKTNAGDGNATGYLLVSNAGGDLILLKDGGTYLGYASTGISFYDTFVHLKIVAIGSNIKVYVNNETVPRIDVSDTAYQCGYISLNTCYTHVHFKNVSVSAAAPKNLIAYKNTNVNSTLYSTDFSNGAGDWTPYSGTWAVENGEYSQSSTSYYNASSIVTGGIYSDVIVEADMKLMQSDGSWGGINFRKANAGDGNATGYLLVSNAGGDLILLKDGGTYLGTASTGISFYNTFVHLKIVACGSHIQVFANNEAKPRIDINDTSYQSGYISLNACFTHVHFDNVSIKSCYTDTTLNWSPATGAVSYNLYKRPDFAGDGHYENLNYSKVNTSPITNTNYVFPYADETYRVTAVYSYGMESDMSDMVFPVEHYGLEVLSIQYLDLNNSNLKTIPTGSMNVKLNVINCNPDMAAVIQAKVYKADGTEFDSYTGNITLTGDGRLHSYALQLTGLTNDAKSIETILYDSSMTPISAAYVFKPLGTSLLDTYFENGFILYNPEQPPHNTVAGTLDFGVQGATPQWDIGPWGTNWNWIRPDYTAPLVTLADGSVTYSTPSLGIGKAPDGTISLTQNASMEFPYTRQLSSENFDAGAGNWTPNIGAWAVVNGEYQQSSTSYDNANTTLTGKRFSRAEIDVDVKLLQTGAGKWGGISFYKTNANDAHTDSGYTVTCTSNGVVSLLKGGTALATANTGVNFYNKFVHVRVIAFNQYLDVYVNNSKTACIQVSDNTCQIGYISLSASTMCAFDNFNIYENWYGPLLEVANPNWPTPDGTVHISDANTIMFTADIRITKCENKTSGDYDPNIHAAQYALWFHVSGANEENLWFGGIPTFDNRHDQTGVFEGVDTYTSTLMYVLPPSSFKMDGTFKDGQWHSLSYDVRPLLLAAYNRGIELGVFQTSRFEDLVIDEMNTGIETPGTFDVGAQIRNFQLVIN